MDYKQAPQDLFFVANRATITWCRPAEPRFSNMAFPGEYRKPKMLRFEFPRGRCGYTHQSSFGMGARLF